MRSMVVFELSVNKLVTRLLAEKWSISGKKIVVPGLPTEF